MALKQKIQDQIIERGMISVEEYMTRCSFDDDFGYYKNKVEIGRKGADFTTSPEISQVFGELIALFIINQWQLNPSSSVHVLELGPGLGTFMQDMMRVFIKFPDFYNALAVHFVETNPYLIQKQKETFKNYSRIHWYEHINFVPKLDGFAFIVANEFFDALPIKQFIIKDGKKIERHVVLDNSGNFKYSREGDIVEERDVHSIMSCIESCFQKAAYTGMLVIDYGYFQKDDFNSTLQGIKQGAYQSELSEPGLVDLSSHVDFLKLRDALPSFLNHSFMTTQGEFLKALGIEERVNVLIQKAKGMQKMDLITAYARLTSNTHMGNLFKVLYASSHA